MSATLMALRASSEAGTAEQKRQSDKKRNILILVRHFLKENGYLETALQFQNEAGATISKFEVADNVDLGIVLDDYEAYFEMRFDKKPKLVRKLRDDEVAKVNSQQAMTSKVVDSKKSKKAVENNQQVSSNGKQSSGLPIPPTSTEDDGVQSFGVQGTSVNNLEKIKRPESEDRLAERILKPPPQFGGDAEMKQLATVISREIYQESPNVRFDDIVELDEAKRLLSEAVQLPLKFPSLFTGILRPWKGILLHGPPGTGKTLLAKAVATECQTTFFNISASTLVSKWRGDSEKLVRALFELARHYAPSTVFLDEIDSILTSRGGEGSEHEASRRMKTELLIQMDGVKGSKANEQVFVMAASNLPWDLDTALLRRLEKRVFVPLPEAEAREAMLRRLLSDRAVSNLDFSKISQNTSGYSGADIELLCREAAMRPVRRLVAKLLTVEAVGATSARNGSLRSGSNNLAQPSGNSLVYRTAGAPAFVLPTASDVDALIRSDLVTQQDLDEALEKTRSSSSHLNIQRYIQWQEEFGSV